MRRAALGVLVLLAVAACKKSNANLDAKPRRARAAREEPYPPRVASSGLGWIVSEGGAAGFLPAAEDADASFHMLSEASHAREHLRSNGNEPSAVSVDAENLCKVLPALREAHERVALDIGVMGDLTSEGVACVRAYQPKALAFYAHEGSSLPQFELLTHLDGVEALGASGASDALAKLLGTRAQSPDSAQLRYVNLVMGKMSAEGFQALAERRNLKALGFRGVNHASQPSGVTALAKLPDLERIDLSYAHGSFGDEELAAFAGATKLRWVSLEADPIGEAGLLPLAKTLVALEFLDLTFTKANDAAVDALARLPKLRWLRLSGTAVTPHVLEALGGSTSLDHLELPKSALPAITAFRAAHPKIKVRVEGE